MTGNSSSKHPAHNAARIGDEADGWIDAADKCLAN
jgi:hypothetical protein